MGSERIKWIRSTAGALRLGVERRWERGRLPKKEVHDPAVDVSAEKQHQRPCSPVQVRQVFISPNIGEPLTFL